VFVSQYKSIFCTCCFATQLHILERAYTGRRKTLFDIFQLNDVLSVLFICQAPSHIPHLSNHSHWTLSNRVNTTLLVHLPWD